jgi:hypothetical protein
MRGVGVNPVGVRRVTVLFFFIERTFPEAAEQTPAQERGPRRRPEPRTITDTSRGTRRSPTRAGGFVFAELIAPAPLLSVPVAMPPGTRDFCVKPGSERPFYTPVHR